MKSIMIIVQKFGHKFPNKEKLRTERGWGEFSIHYFLGLKIF
jgi:hypothetical protein